MPQSIFLADATQFIDGVNQTYAIAGIWNLGVQYNGGTKGFARRCLGSFNVFGAAASGRPLAINDIITAVDLLLLPTSYIGPTGWSANVERLDRANWDYTSADWNNYRAGSPWTAAGGDVATPPAAVGYTTNAIGGDQVIGGMLAYVTDAIANRGGRVLLRVRAVDEAPSQTQWVSYDAALTSPTRPRLRVTYTSADPSPIDDPGAASVHGAPAARPAPSGRAASATAPARSTNAAPNERIS